MLSYELKDQIAKYIDGEITFGQLEEWYVPRLPLFLQAPDSADADMIAEIELAAADWSAGSYDEAEVRRILADAMAQYPIAAVSSTNENSYSSKVTLGSASTVKRKGEAETPEFQLSYASW